MEKLSPRTSCDLQGDDIGIGTPDRRRSLCSRKSSGLPAPGSPSMQRTAQSANLLAQRLADASHLLGSIKDGINTFDRQMGNLNNALIDARSQMDKSLQISRDISTKLSPCRHVMLSARSSAS
ncbi:uncharacterized protein LOC135808691 [Sycon ciliatum]|uniref:uncharacterized protein LOC135808691 n=1 Tax=Sycon ciliatum TaxID=27933 RepID=UPI0020AD63DA|eukprot:scpid69406/ scgid33300/ 